MKSSSLESTADQQEWLWRKRSAGAALAALCTLASSLCGARVSASSLALRRQASAAEEAVEDDFEGIEKLQQLGINIGTCTAVQASISSSLETRSKLYERQQEVLCTSQQLCRASCTSLASVNSAR